MPLHERAPEIDRQQTRVNEQIRITPILVIGEEGQKLGVMATLAALTRARELELDLVEVSPTAKPPVCRIMDYGKYKYEKGKKQRHAPQAKLKEIRLRPKTGDHDIEFKVKQAKGFLEHKDKVQVTVVFRGRELAHIEEGRRVMDEVIKDLAEIGKLESPPQQNQKRMICTIAPKA
ncbi:MAG TPA: translation initiation factor IF-3 [Pirellulaceae bacterium]|nr:translation initiation factor IF-3 [Pirellulaceae bacterium]